MVSGAKISRNKDKVEAQSTKLNPSTLVLEAKIDSVRESSLSDNSMTLVQLATETPLHTCCAQSSLAN